MARKVKEGCADGEISQALVGTRTPAIYDHIMYLRLLSLWLGRLVKSLVCSTLATGLSAPLRA